MKPKRRDLACRCPGALSLTDSQAQPAHTLGDAVPVWSPIFQGFALSGAAPSLVLPSDTGTEIGATATVTMPICCVIPISRAVDTERSTMRPLPMARVLDGHMRTWPVSVLVTRTV